MNWKYIFLEALSIFIKCAIIVAAFYLSHYYVSWKRKNEDNKANLGEKIVIVFTVIFGSAFVAVAISKGSVNRTLLAINFLVVVIPGLIGVLVGLSRDSKLTYEERKIRKRKMEREEEENRRKGY